ncbi:Serine/threonine-protein phosphatase 7 long form homolog [Linum grandiflorum]
MELCTPLMERWRPETNTFHMYHGEMTITLEDGLFIAGLPVDGAAVFEEYPYKDYKTCLSFLNRLNHWFNPTDKSRVKYSKRHKQIH